LVNVEIDFQILEEKPSSLPWLENKRLEEQAETTKEGPLKDAPAAVWKPYVSGNIISVIYTVIKSVFNQSSPARTKRLLRRLCYDRQEIVYDRWKSRVSNLKKQELWERYFKPCTMHLSKLQLQWVNSFLFSISSIWWHDHRPS
jgi:hypothetical protein